MKDNTVRIAFFVLVLWSALFNSADAVGTRPNTYGGVYDPGKAAGWQIRWLIVKDVVLLGMTYRAAAARVNMSPNGVRNIVLRYLASWHLRPGRSGGQASCAPRLRLYELLYLKVSTRGPSFFSNGAVGGGLSFTWSRAVLPV